MTTVGFLGTGTMGLPMARHVAQAGVELRVWNRTREKAEPLAETGATICGDPAEAADGADIVLTMLSDADAVLEAAARALEHSPRGLVWAQMSTIGPEGTQRCQDLAERIGAILVDAPVLGTREPAEQGKLVVLASGPDEALATCWPLFEAMGSRVLKLGAAGSATRAKLVVNSWVLGVTGLLAETISLAEALDIDPRLFFEAVEGGTLDLPYARLKGEAMIDRDFQDAAFRLALARKDADLVVGAAEAQQLEVPVLRAVAERLRRAQEAGHGDEDMAANFWATAPGSGLAGDR